MIFYRDGVGQGQLDLVKKHEIETIEKELHETYGKEAPKLMFIVVTKRLNDRFFQCKRLKELTNPRNGLIVHSAGEKDYVDFFMVAQNVN